METESYRTELGLPLDLMETDGYLADDFDLYDGTLAIGLLAQVEAELFDAREALAGVAHELGGDINDPRTIVQAAQSARAGLNRHLGHPDIPRQADGRSQPFSVVGR